MSCGRKAEDPSRNAWLDQVEEDRARAAQGRPFGMSLSQIREALSRDVEVYACQADRVTVMRMRREDFERCLGEYRHLPWRILMVRLVGDAR